MLSTGVGDVIQPLSVFSGLSSQSSAVAYTPVSSVSTSTPAAAQPPSAQRVAAVAGRPSQPTSNSLSTAHTQHSTGVLVSSTLQRDNRTASQLAATSEFGRDRCAAAASTSVRPFDASSTKVGSDQAPMVIDAKDSVSSRRGRLVQPTAKVSAPSEVAQSLQNDSSSTSFVQQRPSSSSQHIRSTPHRSALAANVAPVSSMSETVSDATTTDAAPEPSSPSFLQSSKAASLPQNSTALDVGKSVS